MFISIQQYNANCKGSPVLNSLPQSIERRISEVESINMQTKLCILYTFPRVGKYFKNIFVDFSAQSFRKYFVLDTLQCEECWDTRIDPIF